MLKRWWIALAGLSLFVSFQAFATKYVPIAVGDITVIIPVDEEPMAVDDSDFINEMVDFCDATSVDAGFAGCSKSINLTTNDSDPEGTQLSIVSVSGAQHATSVTISEDLQQVVYVPAPSFYSPQNGSDSFSYTVQDAAGSQATATVSLVVNRAPVTVSYNHDIPLSQTTCFADKENYWWLDCMEQIDPRFNDGADPEGDAFAGFVLENHAVYGSAFDSFVHYKNGIVWAPGALHNFVDEVPWAMDPEYLTYQMGECFIDPSSDDRCFVNSQYRGWFEYKVLDERGALSAIARVDLSISGNNPPVAVADVANTPMGTAVDVDVLSNDTDAENNTISLRPTSHSQPANGTVVKTGNIFTYTPDSGFQGTDTFNYYIHDGNQNSATGLVSVNVEFINSLPVAANDTVQTPEDTAVFINALSNDSDPDGTALSLVQASVNHGSVYVTSENQLEYMPPADFDQQASIAYTIQDAHGGLASATVTVTVTPVNDAPVFTPSNDPANAVSSGNQFSFTPDVSDIETASGELTFSEQNVPAWLTFNAANGSITGTPSNDDQGTYTMSVIVSDGELSDTFSFTLTVTPVNHAPTAQNVNTSTNEDTSVTFSLSGTDPDNDPLTYEIVSQPGHGTVTVSGSSATYVPADNHHDPDDAFTFRVSDAEFTSSPATAYLTIVSVNDAPVISGTPVTSVTADAAYSFTPIASDIDNDTLTFSVVNAPDWASFNTSTGTLSGTPGISDVGTYTNIVVSVSDGIAPPVSLPPFSIIIDNEVSVTVVIQNASSAALSTASVGQSVNIVWSATGAESCTSSEISAVTGASGTVSFSWFSSGSKSVTVTCEDLNGQTASDSATITINKLGTPAISEVTEQQGNGA